MNKTINFRSFKRVLWGLQFNYFLPHKTGLPIPKSTMSRWIREFENGRDLY